MRAYDFLNESDDEDLLKEIISHEIAQKANSLFNRIQNLSDNFKISAYEAFEEDYGSISIEIMNTLLTVRRDLGENSVTYKKVKDLFNYLKK